MTTLKDFREQKGYTQEHLAARANISRLTIINLENGHFKDTTAGTLQALAKALDVSMDDVFSMLKTSNVSDTLTEDGKE